MKDRENLTVSRDTLTPAKALCIHQLFEAQVEQTPEAAAVTFTDGSCTLIRAEESVGANPNLALRYVILAAKHST